MKSQRVEDVADPLLKNAFPFKTLESLTAPRWRIAPGAVRVAGEFFASLREVSALRLLDLAGVGSGLIEKRSRSRVFVASLTTEKSFAACPALCASEKSRFLSLAVDREGKDQ